MLCASPVQEGSFHELQRRETTRHLACSGSGPRSSVSPEQQGPLPSLMGAAERVRQRGCGRQPASSAPVSWAGAWWKRGRCGSRCCPSSSDVFSLLVQSRGALGPAEGHLPAGETGSASVSRAAGSFTGVPPRHMGHITHIPRATQAGGLRDSTALLQLTGPGDWEWHVPVSHPLSCRGD